MNLLLVEMRMAMEYDSKISKYPRKPFYATSDTRYKLVEKRNGSFSYACVRSLYKNKGGVFANSRFSFVTNL